MTHGSCLLGLFLVMCLLAFIHSVSIISSYSVIHLSVIQFCQAVCNLHIYYELNMICYKIFVFALSLILFLCYNHLYVLHYAIGNFVIDWLMHGLYRRSENGFLLSLGRAFILHNIVCLYKMDRPLRVDGPECPHLSVFLLGWTHFYTPSFAIFIRLGQTPRLV